MIRKAVIVVLTLAALASFLVGLASLVTPIAMTVHSDKHKAEYVGFRVKHAFLSLIWSRTSSETCPSRTNRRFDLSPVAVLEYASEPWDFATYEVVITSEKHFQETRTYAGPLEVVVPRGGTHMVSRVSVRCAVLCVIACAYPAIVFIRGPLLRWRRRKRGECLNCGYNLTGNVTGICSECGVPCDA